MDANQELISSTLALNVALKTMKERCLSLQKHTDFLQNRLQLVEKENIKLKHNPGSLANMETEYKMKGSVSEIAFLRAQNQELQNQKSILNENIKLISKENRQLWTRLSQLTKEDQMTANNENQENGKVNPHSQIVRSRTFTVSHNPKLKERNNIDTELDEISLDSYGDQNDVDTSNKMFGYLQDSLNDPDNDVENVKKIAEGLLCIKKELLKQQSDLKVALTNWRKFKNSDNCKACKERAKIVKPVMVDKYVETDEELTIELDLGLGNSPPNSLDNNKNSEHVIDMSEAKSRASGTVKVCPMCGELFDKGVTFEKFQEHVESHFLSEQVDLDHNPLDFEVVGLGNF